MGISGSGGASGAHCSMPGSGIPGAGEDRFREGGAGSGGHILRQGSETWSRAKMYKNIYNSVWGSGSKPVLVQ